MGNGFLKYPNDEPTPRTVVIANGAHFITDKNGPPGISLVITAPLVP